MKAKPIPKLSTGLILIAVAILGFVASEPITAVVLGIRPTPPYPYSSLGQASTHSTLATFVEIAAGLGAFIGIVITIQELR